MSVVWCWSFPVKLKGPAWHHFNALLWKEAQPVLILEIRSRIKWLIRNGAKSCDWHLGALVTRQRAFVKCEPADRPVLAPAADSVDAAGKARQGMEDDVLPCSRSCWSYHGSSSSVTNSSILPELSIWRGDPLLLHPGNLQGNNPLCVWTIELLQQGPPQEARSFQDYQPELRTVLYSAVLCASTCFLFPSSPLCVSSVTPTSSLSHPTTTGPSSPPRPAATVTAAETWQRCCNKGTSFLSLFSETHSRCLHVLLVYNDTVFVSPLLCGFR